MKPPRKIAILTLGVGSGHLQASVVIQRALYDGGEDVETRLIDALDLAEEWFLWLYVRTYWLMLRHARPAWRLLFKRRDRKGHRATAPHWFFRRGCVRVLRELKAYAPDLVIATEIGAAEIAALGRREDWFRAPILVAQTDFHAEPPWVQPEIDFYCVGSDRAKLQLIGWGVSPHRILVSGVPIDSAFVLGLEKREVRRSLGLDPDRPVVLVMGGGMGPAPLDQIVMSLERCGLPLQVLAVAGHDRALQVELERLRGRIPLDLHSFGWTSNIRELMAAADLLISKPGGVTVSEALAAGLPLIVTHPIPGPEERHVRYLVESGVAVHAATLEEIPHLVSLLIGSPARHAEMSRKARELARPEAAHSVVQVGFALMEKTTYIDLLAAPPERRGESAYLM
ncbi:MAG TPA: glycosyltransferase [Terriglobia bacterium]|nr:glycosyltransferase [Terriglobia bacterium]